MIETILFLHSVLYSWSAVGTRKIAIPLLFLEVEQPKIEQLTPGITNFLAFSHRKENFPR